MEEKNEQVVEDTTQETTEQVEETKKPNINEDGDYVVDLRKPIENETKEDSVDDDGVVTESEDAGSTQEQEEVQPEAETQEESALEEITEEETVEPIEEEVQETTTEAKATEKEVPENIKELIDFSGQVVQSQPIYSKGLMQGIKDTWSKLTSWAQKYYITFLSLPQIQELFPDLPGVKLLQDNLENRANDLWKKSENLNEQMKAIREIEAKYSPEIIKKWTMITFELSNQNVNPALAKNRDHGLVQEFKTLPRELQGLALGMHRNYMLRAKETLDALEKLTGKDVDYLRRQFKRKKLEFYQPFMRQGDYWFDYEIQTDEGTETVVIAAQTPAERERLNSLELSPLFGYCEYHLGFFSKSVDQFVS